MVVPQKLKNKTVIWTSDSTLNIYPKELKAGFNQYLHTHVHSSFIHCSLNEEATQVSTDWWTGKHSVIYTYQEILFSLKKEEENTNICYNTDEPSVHYAKWYVTKTQIPYDPTYKSSQIRDKESIMVVSRGWGGRVMRHYCYLEVQVLQVWKRDGDYDCTLRTWLIPLNSILKNS